MKTINVPRMRRYTGWTATTRETPRACPSCGRLGYCSSCCCVSLDHRLGRPCKTCGHEGSHR